MNITVTVCDGVKTLDVLSTHRFDEKTFMVDYVDNGRAYHYILYADDELDALNKFPVTYTTEYNAGVLVGTPHYKGDEYADEWAENQYIKD